MGIQFRKRLKIVPGLYLNVSAGGTSWSIGMPGAMINFGGKKGTKATFGMPGTGVSFTQKYPNQKVDSQNFAGFDKDPEHFDVHNEERYQVYDSSMTPVISADLGTIAEMGLSELVEMLNESERSRKELKSNIDHFIEERRLVLNKIKVYDKVILRSFFKKKLIILNESEVSLQEKIDYLALRLAEEGVFFDWSANDKILAKYRALLKSFTDMASSEKIWDILSFKETDKFIQRTQADTEVSRSEVKFSMGRPDCLPVSKDDEFKKVPHLENRNGADIYLFPGFLLMESEGQFAAISITELDFNFNLLKFAETESLPQDAEVEGNTWLYANKSGSPDMKFNDNYAIPWAIYGNIEFKFRSVIHEQYLISNHDAARHFSMSLHSLIDEAANYDF